jgi:protein-disulfide isomerase/uncharacterized membrane protein
MDENRENRQRTGSAHFRRLSDLPRGQPGRSLKFVNKGSTKMKKISPRIILLALIAIVGIAFSVILSHQYYEIRNGAGGFKSICNISQKMNCDAVAASPYAEFIGGIPLSSFATGWFLAALLISIGAFFEDWRRASLRWLTGIYTVGSGASVFYFFIMAAVLKTYCLFCLLIDGLNFLGLGLAWSLVGFGRTTTESTSQQDTNSSGFLKPMLGIIVGSLFVSVVLGKNMDNFKVDAATAEQVIESVIASAPVAIEESDLFPSIGPKDAPVTIVEFSDFQCPYCRIGAMTMNSVLNRYPGKVRLVFRNFPLDPSCNPMVQHAMHPVACIAARTTVCANKQGKFKEVYENIFEHQANLATQGAGSPTELAKESGANPEQLSSCVAAPETAAAISRDIEEAKRLGIQSTPTFFVNGKKVEGGLPTPMWNKLIDRLLSSTQKN